MKSISTFPCIPNIIAIGIIITVSCCSIIFPSVCTVFRIFSLWWLDVGISRKVVRLYVRVPIDTYLVVSFIVQTLSCRLGETAYREWAQLGVGVDLMALDDQDSLCLELQEELK